MQVLVDTTIWSLALRKKVKTSAEEKLIAQFKEIVEEGRAHIIGPIRQEVLSGISMITAYEALKNRLEAFDDIPLLTCDYELAAVFFNLCRKKGIQGSHIDFLICSISQRLNLSIFTTDKDFDHYAKYIPIQLIGL